MAATSEPAFGSVRQNAPLISPAAERGSHCRFCSSDPPSLTGCVDRADSSRISDEALLYFATSSTASARARNPASEPPYSVGIVRPSRPRSLYVAKMSSGYSPLSSISAARGATFSRATRRAVSRISLCASDSSKSMFTPFSRIARGSSPSSVASRRAAPHPQPWGMASRSITFTRTAAKML